MLEGVGRRWEVLEGVGRRWEVLGGAGRRWEVLGGAGMALGGVVVVPDASVWGDT